MSSPVVLPPQNLPFSNFVQVSITISPNGALLPSFNKGLVITDDVTATNPIPPSGAGARVRGYTSLSAILQDGHTTASLAYQAALMYFAQQPPAATIYLGVRVATGLTAAGLLLPSPTGGSAGAGYAVGDFVSVAGGTLLAILKVAAITSNGSVHGIPSAYTIISCGTGYAIASAVALTTITGLGAGATVGITAIGETVAEAVNACRAINSDWYGFTYYSDSTNTPDADSTALTTFAQAATPPCVYFGQSADPGIPAGTVGNLFLTLQAASFNRAYMLYSTTQNSAAPNNAFAAAGAMGVAMGRNTGAASSYFTMMFKPIVGVIPEPLQQYEVDNICGAADGSTPGAGGNVLVQYPNVPMMQKGVMPNGQFFDQILQLDMLGADLQISCVDELVEDSALNQSDSAQMRLLNRCNGACDRSVTRGYIGPGTWNGSPILNQLATGDTLAAGFKCMSDTYNNQAPADKTARKSMPIFIALNQAGVVQSVLIAVSVQQ